MCIPTLILDFVLGFLSGGVIIGPCEPKGSLLPVFKRVRCPFKNKKTPVTSVPAPVADHRFNVSPRVASCQSRSNGIFRCLFIFLLEQFAFILTVAWSPYLHADGVMKDTIEDGRGGDGVSQVIGPVRFFHVGGKDQGFIPVVTLIDHFKQQVGFFGYLQLETIMPHFVNDQQIRVHVFS